MLYGALTGKAIEVGRSKAGIGGIDFQRSILEFLGQSNCSHVNGCFGAIIGKQIKLCMLVIGITVEGQGPQAAGHVDNPACRRLQEEWKHNPRYGNRTEKVGFERCSKVIHRQLAWSSAASKGNARIVN
ncbi:hypothetical protein D3C81_1946410 [compost metagenome]